MKKFVLGILLLVLAILIALPFYYDQETDEITQQVRAGVSGSFAALSDGLTHYELAGPNSAQTVLLVHGATVPYYIWDPTFAALRSAGFRVLRYDMYGRGYSDRPDVTYDRDLFERQIIELLDSLHITQPVDIAGLSMGGAVAAGFIANHPDRIRKMVFIDPLHDAVDISWLAVPYIGDYLASVSYFPSLAKSQMDDFFQPERFPDWPDRYREQMQYRGFRRAILSTLRHYMNSDKLSTYVQVGESGKPALLIWGKEDHVLPFDTNVRLRAALPAEFVAVERAGHVSHLERPDIVNARIIQFLTGDSGSSASQSGNWWDKLPRPEWAALQPVDISQTVDWFEVYQAAAGVFAIYEPGHWQEAIAYLICGRNRALLFDTLMGIGDLKSVVRQLTDLDVIVLNSHTHPDHIGGNHQFSTIYAVDTGYTRQNAKGLPNARARRFVGENTIWKQTPSGFSRSTYSIKPFKITRFVEDGEIIDLGDRVLEVFLTPGHAPDGLCLLDRSHRLLFTGDTFYLTAPLYAQFPEADFKSYLKSAKRLSRLAGRVQKVLPGHNVTNVAPVFLTRMFEAFTAIETNTATFKERDGIREYSFESGLAVLLKAARGEEGAKHP